MKRFLSIIIFNFFTLVIQAQVVFTEDFSTATIASYDAIADFKSAALCNGYINTVNNTCAFNTINGGVGGVADKFLFNGTKAGGNYVGEFWGTIAGNIPTVLPNTFYTISFWVNANQVRPPAIDVFINSDSVGRIVPISTTSNWQWAQYSLVWYSDAAFTADISLVNKNNESLGCDWGLDNITLTEQPAYICNATLTGANLLQNASFETYSTCPNLTNNGSATYASNWATTGGSAGTGAQLMVNNASASCVSPRPQASWNINNNLPSGAQGSVWLGLASTKDVQNTLATPTQIGAVYEFSMQAQCAKFGPNYVGESGTISLYGIKAGEADFLRKHLLGTAIILPDGNLYPSAADWQSTTLSLVVNEAYDRILFVANGATDGNSQFYAYLDNMRLIKTDDAPCQQVCPQNMNLVNLCNNASFETYSACPTIGTYGTISTATHWISSGTNTGAQLLVNNGICTSARPSPSWNTLNDMNAGSNGSAWLGLATGKDAQNTLMQSMYANKYYELTFDATMAKLTPTYNGDNGTISIYGIKVGEPNFTKTHFLGKAIIQADGIFFPDKWTTHKAIFKTTDVFDRIYFIAENAIDGNMSAYYYIDNLQLIEDNLKGCIEFGDAPDIYKTELASNGASHAIANGRLKLGVNISIDADGQPDSTASFDMSDDGLVSTFKVLTTSTNTYSITVNATNETAKAAYVCAFIDFNADGDFNDVGEKSKLITVNSNVNTNATLTFSGFAKVITKPIYARVRISTDSTSTLISHGSAPDGEVEDYVIPPQHIPVVNDSVITTPEDVPITFCTAIQDIDASPHTLTTLKAPIHGTYLLAYSSGKACIMYASNLNYFGTDTLVFITCDTTGLCDTTVISFNITPVPDAPVASNTTAITSEATGVTVCAAINDPEGGLFTVALLNCIQHGTATVTGGTNYCITYTPDYYYSGADNACVIVCDNTGLCDTAYIAITINPIAHLQSDVNATFVNTAITGDVSTNDKLLIGNTYSAITVADINNPVGSNFSFNTNGTYNFTGYASGIYKYKLYCVNGQVVSDSTDLKISVIDSTVLSNVPVANTDYAMTLKNNDVIINTLQNDKTENGGSTLSGAGLSIISNPMHGLAVINTITGNITYTPTNNYIGADTIIYQICDNANASYCSKAMQIIHVIPNNIANLTTATDDFNSANYNTAIIGNVLFNDIDAENNLQATLAQNINIVGVGNFVLDVSGNYTFTPVSSFQGPTKFTYTVCDNSNTPACANATLYLLTKGIVFSSLGISITDFSANKVNNTVALKWVTLSENNNNYFTISHSTDGMNYSKIISQTSKAKGGNNTGQLLYNGIHLKPKLDGDNFYKLQATDFNNKTITYNILKINYALTNNVNIYPVPAQNALNVVLQNTESQLYTYKVFDMQGRLVLENSYYQEAGVNYKSLDITTLVNGVYTLMVINENNQSSSHRIIISK